MTAFELSDPEVVRATYAARAATPPRSDDGRIARLDHRLRGLVDRQELFTKAFLSDLERLCPEPVTDASPRVTGEPDHEPLGDLGRLEHTVARLERETERAAALLMRLAEL